MNRSDPKHAVQKTEEFCCTSFFSCYLTSVKYVFVLLGELGSESKINREVESEIRNQLKDFSMMDKNQPGNLCFSDINI